MDEEMEMVSKISIVSAMRRNMTKQMLHESRSIISQKYVSIGGGLQFPVRPILHDHFYGYRLTGSDQNKIV